jgi:NAD(P)-dependent dehydrogenase (short-subunit alcohol dehydrogenase family)
MLKGSKNSVLISGGAQGIGKITAKHLLECGYQVYALDIDREALDELKTELANVIPIVGDISHEKTIIEAMDLINNDLYGIINNAAISTSRKIEEISLDEWNQVIAVNLTATFLTAKHGHQFLKNNNGSIVNIASTRALMSEPNTEAYSASKGGILSLTHALAISFAPHVRVNAISPGWIETSHLKKKSDKKGFQHSVKDSLQHPAGKVGEAQDIANMVAYLLSDNASFITGQNFVIDGGMTKKMIYV